MVASWGNPVEIRVFLEGSDGRSLDCANVIAIDPKGTSLLMEYEGDRASYVGSIYAPPGGSYRLEARSRAGDCSISVPFIALTSRPSILTIADSSGNSAMAGQALASGAAIAVSWNSVVGSTAYLVRVLGSGSVVYQRSCAEPGVTIPADTLAAGSFTVSVEAQAIAGDPLFGISSYYSASSAKSASVAFTVQ